MGGMRICSYRWAAGWAAGQDACGAVIGASLREVTGSLRCGKRGPKREGRYKDGGAVSRSRRAGGASPIRYLTDKHAVAVSVLHPGPTCVMAAVGGRSLDR